MDWVSFFHPVVGSVAVESLKIGNLEARNLHAMHPHVRILDGDERGLLGQHFLGSYDLDLDLGKGKVALFEYNKCGEGSAYWTQRYDEADLTIRDKQIAISVEVNGRSTRAVLDTGSPRSSISWDLARRLGLTMTSPGVMQVPGYGDVSTTYDHPALYRFSSLKIGDEIVKNPIVLLRDFARHPTYSNYPLDLTDGDVVLGVDFIKNHHIYINNNDSKMYFSWNGGAVFSPLAK
jgi:Aspartyl protease